MKKLKPKRTKEEVEKAYFKALGLIESGSTMTAAVEAAGMCASQFYYYKKRLGGVKFSNGGKPKPGPSPSPGIPLKTRGKGKLRTQRVALFVGSPADLAEILETL